MRTAIIGGGIAGLAAAFELEKAGAEYTLFEAGNRLGGVISSATVAGSALEDGPDSFLTEKPAAAELCRELGLGDELIPSNDAQRKTWIVVGKRLVALPDGLMFLIPTKLMPTAMTPLFSLGTKIRMARELLHPPRRGEADESVASMIERHYGAEVVDRLAGPLLSGIYGGEANQLSARAVLPKLVEMEAKYGSLTRAMLAVMKGRPTGAGTRATFTTLRGGLQQMIDALAARLKPEAIRLKTPVRMLERVAEGWRVTTAGSAQDSGSEVFDAVIVASPAWAAADLLRTVDAQLSEELAAIPYSSSIAVNLVYDEKELGPLPEGFGFLVPASAGRAMLACTFAHRKFLGRIAPGKAVLRAFLGGVRNAALVEQPDDVLITTARRELSEILGTRVLGIHIEPEETRVSRWPRAMAQYAVGHLGRVKRIRARVDGLTGLHLVGNAYDGIGISDCIRLGRGAAREIAGVSVS
ncbi:protoporphyrinogen oxidase [Terracidiphilus gabretensis]|uniref:protoporphyrinogen oxidase n=1 Tax=Terracidiphilus gabretensis TaxID=1577687 RepID=UPI0018D25FB3|nr:protoporphyrinogen oxidase [Terracidiphilus gabretensis]